MSTKHRFGVQALSAPLTNAHNTADVACVCDLLMAILKETLFGENRPKRLFGYSSWACDYQAAFVASGLVRGTFEHGDPDSGDRFLESVNEAEAEAMLRIAVDALAKVMGLYLDTYRRLT